MDRAVFLFVATATKAENADRTKLLIEVLIGFAVIITLAIVGWTTRRRRQRSIPAPEKLPEDLGSLHREFEGFYVSTTQDGQPLNRIAVHGLGFRARATIAVTDKGIVLGLPGNNVFVPRESIREVTRANYTIDRVVEPGGLVLLAWTLGHSTPGQSIAGESTSGAANVDTYLRVEETQDLVDAIRGILPVKSGKPVTSGKFGKPVSAGDKA